LDAISNANQLVDACLAGEPFAWQRLVDEYAPAVIQAIQELGESTGRQFSPADINRLTRDVFEQMRQDDFGLLRTYDPRATFETFVVVITRRIIHAAA
jgi:hypothetical protein